VKEKPLGTVGAIIVLALFIVGIFANFLAPYGYNEIIQVDTLASPSPAHILGADNVGRDVLSRVIFGARISMIVGVTATTLGILISILIAVPSGYVGGKYDLIIQRFVDAWMSFPGLIILLTAMSILGTGMWQIILVLGISYGIGGSRVVRSAVISIKESIYLQAAVATGSQTQRIIIQHVLPNIAAPVIILASVDMGGVILVEASLSFLGFGIPPPQPSWGGMLSGTGRMYMLQAPWMVIWPGLALTAVVYGINMFGDALRDLLDPRLRGGLGRYSAKNIKKIKRLNHRK
jgi:peptide/nickel transport system permease protein